MRRVRACAAPPFSKAFVAALLRLLGHPAALSALKTLSRKHVSASGKRLEIKSYAEPLS
jgi:hypothetical protein